MAFPASMFSGILHRSIYCSRKMRACGEANRQERQQKTRWQTPQNSSKAKEEQRHNQDEEDLRGLAEHTFEQCLTARMPQLLRLPFSLKWMMHTPVADLLHFGLFFTLFAWAAYQVLTFVASLGASACATTVTTVFVTVEPSMITYTLTQLSTKSALGVSAGSTTEGPYFFRDDNGTTSWLGSSPSPGYGSLITGTTSVLVVPMPLTSTFYVTRTLTEVPTITSTVFVSQSSTVSSAEFGTSRQGTGISVIGTSSSTSEASDETESPAAVSSTTSLSGVGGTSEDRTTTTYVTSFVTQQRTFTSSTSIPSLLVESSSSASMPAITNAPSSGESDTTTIHLTSIVTEWQTYGGLSPDSSTLSYGSSSNTASEASSTSLTSDYTSLTLTESSPMPLGSPTLAGGYSGFGVGGWNSSTSVPQSGFVIGTGGAQPVSVSTTFLTVTTPLGTSTVSVASPQLSLITGSMSSSVQFNITSSSSAVFTTSPSGAYPMGSIVSEASTNGSLPIASTSTCSTASNSSYSAILSPSITTSEALSSSAVAANTSITTSSAAVPTITEISVTTLTRSSSILSPSSTPSQYSSGLFASSSATPRNTSVASTWTTSQYSNLSVGPTSTPSQNASVAFTPSSTTLQPIPTLCGESGNFTLNWDDEPIFTPTDNTTAPYPPVFNPYHHLFFSNGYAYVPPPTSAFSPVSPPRMAIFLTGLENNPDNVGNSPGAAGLRPGEINDGPRASINAYWFDAFGAYLGCDNAGPGSCTMVISGFAYDRVAGEEVQVVQQTATLPPCPGFVNCSMSPIDFNGDFRSLSGIQIQAFVDGDIPRIWFMDDLRMGWSNNTCAAGLLRQRSRK